MYVPMTTSCHGNIQTLTSTRAFVVNLAIKGLQNWLLMMSGHLYSLQVPLINVQFARLH